MCSIRSAWTSNAAARRSSAFLIQFSSLFVPHHFARTEPSPSVSFALVACVGTHCRETDGMTYNQASRQTCLMLKKSNNNFTCLILAIELQWGIYKHSWAQECLGMLSQYPEAWKPLPWSQFARTAWLSLQRTNSSVFGGPCFSASNIKITSFRRMVSRSTHRTAVSFGAWVTIHWLYRSLPRSERSPTWRFQFECVCHAVPG